MTKAKTKSRRVWILSHPGWALGREHEVVFEQRTVKKTAEYWPGLTIIPATLTWTPPAKAKKRSAKR